jgi:hypothetical protein
MPWRWHPGIRYLMAQISKTRELACDEHAVSVVGNRREYARSLLHLASFCFRHSSESTPALGIFDSDDLEARVTILIEGRPSPTRTGIAALILIGVLSFGSGVVLARSLTLQISSTANISDKFSGTWNWTFKGKVFATMVLIPTRSGYSGSITNGHIEFYGNGRVLSAKAVPGTSSIVNTSLYGSSLQVTSKDGDDTIKWSVTIRDSTHAEVRIASTGAPANMQSIPAEKVP